MALLRLMVKRILRKYKYPPDQQEEAAQLVLAQAETLCEACMQGGLAEQPSVQSKRKIGAGAGSLSTARTYIRVI